MVTWAEALGTVMGKLARILLIHWRDTTLTLLTPVLTVTGEAFGWGVEQTHSPAFVYLPTADWGKPGPLEGIIGGGLKYAADTAGEIAEDMAEGLADVGETVKDAVLPSFTKLMEAEIEELTAGLGPGSPPEEIEKAVQKLAKRYLERMKEIGKVKAESLPSLAELTVSAALVISANLGLAATGLMAATAVDQLHPLKNPGFRDITSDLIYSFQLPAMIGPILAGPVWPGVIRPWRYRWNEQYPTEIFPPPDLIRQFVREGHLKEFQVEWIPEFGALMKFHGYGIESSKRAWGAHWELVSRGMLWRMFLRGEIDEEELLTQLRYHDIHPDMRKHWLAVQYDLPGYIRTRWAFEWGIWDRGKLEEMWGKRGLDPEYISDVTEAEIKNTYRDAITRIRSGKIRDYRDGKSTEPELRADLEELGIAGGEIDFLIIEAKDDAERERWDRLLDIYTDQYRADVINRDLFQEKLLGLPMREDVAMLTVKDELTRKGLFEEAEEIEVTAE